MGKVWKSIKGVVKKAAPVVGAIAGNAILPGIGGAMAGAFLGSVAAGNNTRQHLFSAGAAGVGAAAGGALAGSGSAAAQTGTQAATQTGTQAATQGATQAATQGATQAATQTATQATFSETAKQAVTNFATKHAASIGAGAGAASGVASGTKVKTPKVENTEEMELLQREKEYEKRKRSSLFETKGGAAGERVGYTGSENRGSIFGN